VLLAARPMLEPSSAVVAARGGANCALPLTLAEMGCQTATAFFPDYAQKHLLTDRFAEPEEIARLIAFVASPLTRFGEELLRDRLGQP
jgi:NAD(P)-dependent dehydrogenase (short-subunit alcohol dehydrogenase family)